MAARGFQSSHFDTRWLLDPVPVDQFLSTVWEQRTLTVRRRRPAHYRALVDTATLDAMLSTPLLRPTQIRLFWQGKEVDTAAIVDGKGSPDPFVDTERLFAYLRSGHTVSIIAIHRSRPEIARLCYALEDVFQCRVQANLYITPPHERGLHQHYDTHDFFVLQLAGCKHWLIRPPEIQLPLRTQPPMYPEPVTSEPVEDVVLEPGDLLYVPRGFVHEARAVDLSVHLTVGVHVVTYHEFLGHLLALRAERDVRWRQSLPITTGGVPPDRAALRQILTRLIDGLIDDETLAHTLDRLNAQFAFSRTPILQGHLLDLARLPGLDERTRVQRRPDVLYQLRRGTAGFLLIFHGKQLEFPLEAEGALAYIARASAPFCALNLPAFGGEEARPALVRQLVEAGFLAFAEAADARREDAFAAAQSRR